MRHDERFLNTDPIYPGNGLPPRPGEDRSGLSPFGRLAKGYSLGKSSILRYDGTVIGGQASEVDMINLTGDDLDACSLVLTLHPPRVVKQPFESLRLDQQNFTGEQSNEAMIDLDFPGTDRPLRWPPLEAVITFGVGGTNTEFVVDYINGVTLSVTASFLRVKAIVTQNKVEGDIGGTSAFYWLAANVGPGFTEGRPQRTIFVGEVDDQKESCIYSLPRFAKAAKLIGRQAHQHAQPVRTKGWIRFWQSPAGDSGVGDVFVKDSHCRVEIPNAAMYFSVFNESGHKMKLSAIFELGL